MKKKNLLLTLLLIATFLIGGGVNSKALAQRSLFGKENSANNYDNSSRESLLRGGTDSEGFTLGGAQNENPTTDAPLGSGIVILMAAGAGYALLKRKEEQQ